MKRRRVFRIAVGMFGLALLLTGLATWGYLCVYPYSLAAWVESVRRPGYTLRYRTRTDTHKIALFDTDDGQLAFYRQRRLNTGADVKAHVELSDRNDANLLDPVRSSTPLVRCIHFAFFHQKIDDGVLIPIRADFEGEMRILFNVEDTSDRSKPDDSEQRTVVDVHILWDSHSADP